MRDGDSSTYPLRLIAQEEVLNSKRGKNERKPLNKSNLLHIDSPF
jgi:hypothetical protein